MTPSEPWLTTWKRRAVTIPILYLLTAAYLALFPFLVLGATGVWLFERRRGAKLRIVLFMLFYLVGESIFVAVLALHWLVAGGWAPGGRERLYRWTEPVGNAWGWTLYSFCSRLFALRVEITGVEKLKQGGPAIVFYRHASLGDVPLAPMHIGIWAGLRIRYVLKAELRNDPVFDLIGGRLGSCFVRRGSTHGGREVEAVCAQLNNLGARDALVVYPEGTRFSPEKRTRVLEKLAKTAPAVLERASALANVMPPQLGGPIELLERNSGADVIFGMHVGFEGAAVLQDFLSGRAIDRHIQIHYRRVPYAEIPRGREALTHWLLDQWAQLDGWVGERLTQNREVTPAQRALLPEPVHEEAHLRF